MSIYYPEVAWSTVVSEVALGSIPHRYYVTVTPDNPNDPGSSGAVKAVGDWLIDFIGRPYQITTINVGSEATRVEVYDVNEVGNGTQNGPYLGQIGYIYRPKNGAFMLTQAQLRRLDTSAPDLINPIEKGIIWGHRGVALGTNLNITKLSLSGISGVVTPDGGWQGGSLLELGVIHNDLPDLNTGDGNYYHWYSNNDGVSIIYTGNVSINGNFSINEYITGSPYNDFTPLSCMLRDSDDRDITGRFTFGTNSWGISNYLEILSHTQEDSGYTQINDNSIAGLTINAQAITLGTDNLNIPKDAVVGYVLTCSGAGGQAVWASSTSSQVYKGVWNASTNTPTLSNGSGTLGWWYRCVVAGTANFGAGNIAFSVGDDVMYNGSIWSRIPGSTYTLVTATDSILGGVKIGSTIGISSGVINVIYGVIGGTACEGNDSRLSDARTPTAHTLDSHSNVTITSNTDGEILRWNGSAWVNNTLAEAGVQGVITGQALTKVNDTNVTLTIGGTPNTSLLQAVSLTLGWTGTLADGRIASASTWNSKQNGHVNLTSLSGLTYASLAFVKMSATGTFSLDTNTYSLSNHTHIHSSLTGLANDDHTQYHTNARGDARYEWKLGNPGADGYVLTSTAGGVRSWHSIGYLIQDLWYLETNHLTPFNTSIGYTIGSYQDYSKNTVIGCYAESNGNNNVVIGYGAFLSGQGDGNIIIGYEAADHGLGTPGGELNNALVISNSSTSTPLIRGDFSTGLTTLVRPTVDLAISYTNTYSAFATVSVYGRREGKSNYITGTFTVNANGSTTYRKLCDITNYISPGNEVSFAVNLTQVYEGTAGYIDTSGGVWVTWGVGGSYTFRFSAPWITP